MKLAATLSKIPVAFRDKAEQLIAAVTGVSLELVCNITSVGVR